MCSLWLGFPAREYPNIEAHFSGNLYIVDISLTGWSSVDFCVTIMKRCGRLFEDDVRVVLCCYNGSSVFLYVVGE